MMTNRIYKTQFLISLFKNTIHLKLDYFLGIFLVLQSVVVFAEDVSATQADGMQLQIKQISQGKKWRRLLYYNSKGKSEIASPEFFIHPNGSHDPYIELLSSYQQMFDQQPEVINDEHVICKYPARFYFLDKEFKKNEFHKIKFCPKFLDFINRASGHSISMVFSAYNLNSPSSAFGHTFLKINKHQQESFDLLNYGINYAANTEGSNPLLYAFQGLFGFYRGEFTAVPFYYKIREYNDFESRDIWEYELKLDYEDVQLLTMHFWELGRGWSWYYFLGKNCSYWALRSIEAVVTDFDFSKELNKILVIPAETIKALNKYPGLVKQVNYRPSIHKQLDHSLKQIDKKDQKKVKQVVLDTYAEKIVNKDQLQTLSTEMLDSALLYYDYKYAKSYIKEEKETLSKKQPLLLARSTRQKSENINPITKPFNPEKIHPPQRVGMGYRTSENFQAIKLNYKMGFHEIIDPKYGMDVPLAMNYVDISLNVYQLEGTSDWKLGLDKFDMIRIESLMPTSFMERAMSWRLKLGINNDIYDRSVLHKVGHVQLDSGLTWALDDSQRALLFMMLSNNIETSARFKNALRISAAPILGLKWHVTHNFATLIELKHQWFWDLEDIWQNQWSADLHMQYFSQNYKTAVYLKSLVFTGKTEGLRHKDTQFELGIRKSY